MTLMRKLVEQWASINSFTQNRVGLERMCHSAADAFAELKADELKILPFENGPGLFLKKRGKASVQLFLGGHLDTVFPPDHPFQRVVAPDAARLVGPGVVDMKGGLVILLEGLKAFEASPLAEKIGWEIFLNPDEEIGSPYSTPFLEACATRCHYALLFEPPLPDGALVSSRKGSTNYRAISRGKAAHMGREAEQGVNAILPIAHLITELACLSKPDRHLLLNVGKIEGGHALNVIPDYAECAFNLRGPVFEEMEEVQREIYACAERWNVEVHTLSSRPPKPFDEKTEAFFELLKACDPSVTWRASGGVCDGNTFGHAGVPTIDCLGACGGMMHTDEEFLLVESLPENAKRLTLLLERLAQGRPETCH